MCEDLKLPPKNEFIPTDFDLMPREENVSIIHVIVLEFFFAVLKHCNLKQVNCFEIQVKQYIW